MVYDVDEVNIKTFELAKQGEAFTVVKTAAETNGARAEMNFTLSPAAYGPPAHIHTQQGEWFEVISGKMIATIDKGERTVEAGQRIEVKAGRSHTFRNGNKDAPLELRVWFEPALHVEWMLTESARSAIRNGGSWTDIPTLEAGYILHQVREEYRLAGWPFFLQDIVFGIVARIARLTGRSKSIQPLAAVS